MTESVVNIGIYISYALILIGVVSAVGFPLLYMMKDLKSAKQALIGGGFMLLLFGLSYAFASGDVLESYAKYNTTAGESKFVSAGLISFYLLAIGSVIAIVYSEISKMFK